MLGVSGATAQSVADAAKAARKNKTETASASRHFDNDNLPTTDGLSVVGPAPAADAKATTDVKGSPADSSAAADKQKEADQLQDKLAKQKAKVDSLNHDVDLDQRELRLRAAAMYADPTIRTRNVQWDKDDAQYRSDLEAKQKQLDDARQQLDEMQDQAHKAGLTPRDSDNSADQDKDKAKN
jgi:hypothetical protein